MNIMRHITRILILPILLVFSGWSIPASAQIWQQISYSENDAGNIVSLGFSETVSAPTILKLDQGVPRIVLDWSNLSETISGSKIDGAQSMVSGHGPISRIRYAKRGSDGLRIVLELVSNASFLEHKHLGSEFRLYFQGQGTGGRAPTSRPDPDRLSYSVPAPRLKPSLARPSQPSTPHLLTPTAPSSKPLTASASLDIYTPKKRQFSGRDIPYPRVAPHLGIQVGHAAVSVPQAVIRPRKPVIVIDPGHGGYDPGALGAKGTKEKAITSAVSERLAAMLRATNRYDVVMTRTKDVYVDHDDRLRIARERGASLFISLHADATENGKASGASVYTLADRAKNRSRNITHTQNWILDVDLSEQTESVGNILVDLAQRKTLSHSSQFAARLLTELEGRVPLVRNSHRRAGFYVLLAPDVPAVLLELGFISNAADESRLKKQSEQDKIVHAVVRAINGHFDAKKQ